MPRLTTASVSSVLRELRSLMKADGASIWILGEDRNFRIVSALGSASKLKGTVIPWDTAPVGRQAIRTGRHVLIEGLDSNTMKRVSSRGKKSVEETATQAFAAVPIPRGKTSVGLLAVAFCHPRAFSPTEIGYMRLVARQLGDMREAKRLLDESQARERAMSAFAEVSALVSGSLELPTVLRRIADNAARILDGSSAFVYLAEPDGTLVGAAATGKWNRGFVGTRVSPEENTAARWAFRNRKTQVVRDAHDDSRVSLRLRKIFGTRALVATPLLADRRAVGALIILDSRSTRDFGRDEVNRVETLANYAAVAIGHAGVHAALRAREAELRVLSERLANAHESERRRISRELHDSVGQGLTALSLELAAVERQGRPIAMARRLLRETIDAARRLSAELHPGILDDLGLVPAVRWYCGAIAERASLTIEFQESGNAEVSPEGAVVLYRALQEALENVQRHARARRVIVRLKKVQRGILLEVEDDGLGAGRASPRRKRPGVGLLAIRERAGALGGWATFESSARGSILRVQLPRPGRPR